VFVCIFVTCADARLTACSVAGGAVVGMFALELDSCTDYNFFVFFVTEHFVVQAMQLVCCVCVF